MTPSRWNLAQNLAHREPRACSVAWLTTTKLRVFFLTSARPSRQQDVPGIIEESDDRATGQQTRLGNWRAGRAR